MNTGINFNNSKRRNADPEVEKAKIAWQKLVVKILRWKDGSLTIKTAATGDKISKKEWKNYCSQVVKMNISAPEKAKQRLDDTKRVIEKYGGFD